MHKAIYRPVGDVSAASIEPTIYAAVTLAGGPAAVARAFGTTRQRVRTWYIGEGRMTDEQVDELARMTGGEITADAIRRAILRRKAQRHLEYAERLIAQAGAETGVAS